ncbi:MAG: enoyl-CoA hydratase/isomerase family protein [Myxococcales bacterium]|nr:MAG: enoyl-CoA hydratase/isomerase family protein [Myxococcales bacterium]
MTALPTDEALKDARLHLQVDGAVATITLNKPEAKNSQTPTMWRALAAIGAALPDDVRVVVLKGAGSCFSAGLDVSLLAPGGAAEESVADLLSADDQTVIDTIGEYQQGFLWLRDPRFVTIAAVHSHAIGAGFQLALSCDLRVVADDVKFCMKEPALGLVPDLTGTQPLVEIVGYSMALDMCATARTIDADEARTTGIANVVVPAAELDERVAALTDALLATSVGAVRETKALLVAASRRSLEEQSLAERTAQTRRFRELSGR